MPREFSKRKPSFSKYPKKKKYGSSREEGSSGKEEFTERKGSSYGGNKRGTPYPKRDSSEGKGRDEKPSFNKKPPFRKSDYDKPFEKREGFAGTGERSFKKKYSPYDKKKFGKPFKKKNQVPFKEHVPNPDGLIRLNRFIANAGICSRREADDLISSGVVKVNGKIITEMGYKVAPTDLVNYGGQSLRREKMVYVLLNKPKDYITTVDDPEKRRTVLELVADACSERIYPVGRLDRSTTGVLLLTNDGELTKVLTHPRYGVRKIYSVEIDQPIKHLDFVKVGEGVELEDGFLKVDKIEYAGPNSKKELIIEIHSGKNRIVRRLFEALGYQVKKLDRVAFAGLTKKDLQRGRWRHLSEKEIGFLKMVQKGE